jgi:hypothetical protein
MMRWQATNGRVGKIVRYTIAASPAPARFCPRVNNTISAPSLSFQQALACTGRSNIRSNISEPEGGYTVTCPALPGLATYSETLDQAREMARDAMEG